MKLKGLKVNFLGDSITEGFGTSAPEYIYHALLKKELKLKEARAYGIGGTRFAKQKFLETPDDPFLDPNNFCIRFEKMDDDADLVLVFGGTNDYGHGNAPIGEMNDRTPETFYGACHYLFSGLIKKYLGKPVCVVTPLHRADEIKETENGTETLKQYVEIIREVAQYYSLPVLDLFATSGLQPVVEEIKEKYVPDGLHPNNEGHKVLAAKMKAFLETL